MNLRRKDLTDVLGDASYGITQAGGSQGASLATELLVSPGQMLYLKIPTQELRHFFDSLAPELAKNTISDCVSGRWHRYKAGHDLFVDVPSTVINHGPVEGLRQVAHIVLTDLGTKDGIPIPGFSGGGLGPFLENIGIHKGWMCINLSDAGFGFLAIADSNTTLLAALQDQLTMNVGTALHTFGGGALEVGVAVIVTKNPLLLIAGLENILAGLAATWNTLSVYVDPLDFFGAAGMSALLGFGFSHGLVGESLTDATRDAIRSGTIGALYSVSSAFGYGALAGFAACRLASALAKHHNAQAQGRLAVDMYTYEQLVDTLCSGNPDIKALLVATEPHWLPAAEQPLPDEASPLPSESRLLPTDAPTLDVRATVLPTDTYALDDRAITLPDDPKGLSDIYHSALSSMALQRCNSLNNKWAV